MGRAYISKRLDEKGALFFIQLKNYEGELAVGIGRRLFTETQAELEAAKYQVEWFERKGKKRHSWGLKPAFKLTVAGYTGKRKKVSQQSLESIRHFLPLIVSTTSKAPKASMEEFTLTQACMAALRSLMSERGQVRTESQSRKCEAGSDVSYDSEEDSAEEEEEGGESEEGEESEEVEEVEDGEEGGGGAAGRGTGGSAGGESKEHTCISKVTTACIGGSTRIESMRRDGPRARGGGTTYARPFTLWL